jgi:hypothetical protein
MQCAGILMRAVIRRGNVVTTKRTFRAVTEGKGALVTGFGIACQISEWL